MTLKHSIILCMLLPFAAIAQNEVKFGVNAGATLSNLRGDSSDDFKHGFDFLVGFALEVPIDDNLSLLGNINYERKTATTSFEDDYDPAKEIDAKFRMHYISIPINAKYYLGSKKNFYIQAGPYAGFFIDDTFLIDGEEVTWEIAGGSDFKLLDIGLSTGIGSQFKIDDKHNIAISLRNNLGISNVSDMPQYKIKTNSFNLVLTWESNM